MKEYIQKTVDKLKTLTLEHPTAELRFGNHLKVLAYCKFLESDIKYDESTNTIYIGF